MNAARSHPLRFHQYDVFAPRPGAGNPLGVVFGAQDWDSARMQRFAAWTNLVETTFVLPPTRDDADYRLRIFTPQKEIAFAGHPTLGSAQAVLAEGFAELRDGQLRQECQAGVLPIRSERVDGVQRLFVRVPSSRRLREANADDAELSIALRGCALGRSAPALVEGGRRWWLAELEHEHELRGLHIEHEAILALARRTDSLGLCVFARCGQARDRLAVRAFPLGVGILEDPASGAANAAIAAYLHEVGGLHALGTRYTVSQGRELGRDAELHLEVDAQGQIWVGGVCQPIIHATLNF